MKSHSRRLDDNEEIETVTTKKVIKKSKRVNNSINPMESQIRQSQWEGDSFSGDEERKKNKILNMIKNAHIEKIKNGVLLREINNAHDEIQRFKYEGDLASAKMMENTLNDLHATVVLSNINPLTKSKLWKTAYYNNPFSSFNKTQWDKTKTMYKTMNVNEQNLYEFSKTTKTKKGNKNNINTEKIEEENNEEEEDVEETQINKSKKSGTRKSKNKSVNNGNNGNNVKNNNNFDNKGNINGDNVGYGVRASIYNKNDKAGGYDNSGNIYDNDAGDRMDNDNDKKMVDNNGNIIINDNDKKMNDNLRNNPNSVMNEQGNVVIPGNKKKDQYEIGHNNEIIVNKINENENEDTTKKKKKKRKTKKKVIKNGKGKDEEKDEKLDLDGRPQQYDVDVDNENQEEEEEDEIEEKKEVIPKETVLSVELSMKDTIDLISHSKQNPKEKQDFINPNHLSQNPIVSQTPTNPVQDKNPSLEPNKVTNPNKSQPEDPNKRSLNPNPKIELTTNPLHPNPQQPGPQYQNPQYSNPQQGNPQLSNPQNPNPQYDKPRNPNDLRGNPDTGPSIPKKKPNPDKYAPRTQNPKTRVDYGNPLLRNPERPLARERGVEPRMRPSSAQRHIINHPYYADSHAEYPKRPILNFGKPLSFTRSQKKRKKRREGIESYITYGNDRRGKCFACDVNCGISVSGNSPSNYNPYKASLKHPRTEKNYYYNEYYQYKSKYY